MIGRRSLLMASRISPLPGCHLLLGEAEVAASKGKGAKGKMAVQVQQELTFWGRGQSMDGQLPHLSSLFSHPLFPSWLSGRAPAPLLAELAEILLVAKDKGLEQQGKTFTPKSTLQRAVHGDPWRLPLWGQLQKVKNV